ncbi:MAG: ribosome biogenesis GTPase Der [Clostridia bacterium]
MKPLVAIIGKPNVGKSTFFNKISGSRISIVLDTPGVTRDRIYSDVDWLGHQFTIVDTGGIELKSTDTMHTHIVKQAELAIEVCDCILFFVDGRSELTADDFDIASLLRRSKKPVLLVVNKIDDFSTLNLCDYYGLGMGEPIPISAEQKLGLGELLDKVLEHLPSVEPVDTVENVKVAVVGKPNVGKSSLVNKLLGYDRSIVTDIAGTTRDSIDTRVTVNGKNYTLIDTAGIRRKRSIEDSTIEQYSVVRSLASIRRADVCLIVIDASSEISEQDVKIAAYCHEQGKPSVVVINKWDTIEKDSNTVNKFNNQLKADLAFMDYFIATTTSALTGQRVSKLWEQIDYVFAKANFRATTGLLNDCIGDAVSSVEPPSKAGKRLKIKYATQVSVCPPTFVIFVNTPTLMHFSYKRYLTNYLRKTFDLQGTPLRIVIRGGNEKDE